MSSGWVVATPDHLGVDVRFDFKFPETVIEGGIAFGAAAAAAIVSDEIWQFILAFVAAGTGFGALLHYGLARSRIERTLRVVAKRVQRTEQESRAELDGLTSSCS